jgi:Raf kinase inhibitor-like YbhB/YbcL family protein
MIACGGGGGSSDDDSDNANADATLTKGYLVDSPIEGVGYSCGDITGLTTSTGEFSCEVAPVTFSIGSLVLGVINTFTSDSKVYPQDIIGVDRSNFTDLKVIALTRLLQSLDDDGEIGERIIISSNTSSKFNIDASGLGLEAQVAMGDGTLVSEADAIAHLQSNMSAYITTDNNTTPSQDATPVVKDFVVKSTAYKNEDTIPSKYTCKGDNISPPYSWENVPVGTAKYAVIMDDENFPCGTGDSACRHWGVFNIPSSTTALAEDLDISTIDGVVEGGNYTGNHDYAGPCPPSEHTYKTTVFALKESMPNLGSVSLTRSQFASTYSEHILDSSTISGKAQ